MAAWIVSLASGLQAASDAVIDVHVEKPTVALPKTLYGEGDLR